MIVMNKDCIFCKIVKDGDKTEIIRFKHSVAILDINQFFRGKTLVIFKRHEEDLTELSEEEREGFFNEMMKVATVVKNVLEPDKLNYALLGNAVYHLHWHIIPRYRNDPNWGGPPWPHDKVKLSEKEAVDLVKRIKKKLIYKAKLTI